MRGLTAAAATLITGFGVAAVATQAGATTAPSTLAASAATEPPADPPTATPSATPTATPTGTSTAGPPPAGLADNPYVGAKGYVNSDWSKKAAAEPGGSKVSSNPTAVWLDRIAAIAGTST
ncbi:MAG: cellulose 1,4-beta-cellobiosidase, partial [Actinoplanes sp.]|nr:cellulose 1,4-beta-cellobiosidase [Actinoplanes sp.]